MGKKKSKIAFEIISERDKMLRFKSRLSRLFFIAADLEKEYILKCRKISSPHHPLAGMKVKA